MLCEDDDRRGLNAAQVDKIKRILARLDEATDIKQTNGVTCPWPPSAQGPSQTDLGDFGGCVVFRFEKGNTHDVDLIDYH